MFDGLRRKLNSAVSEFDAKTERIESQTKRTEAEIEQIEHKTRNLFNRTVAETAARIETLKDADERELVRALALHEFRSISLPGGPGDVSRLIPQAEGGLPKHSI